MPPGEEMFKYHGFSGDCPKPPLPKPISSESPEGFCGTCGFDPYQLQAEIATRGDTITRLRTELADMTRERDHANGLLELEREILDTAQTKLDATRQSLSAAQEALRYVKMVTSDRVNAREADLYDRAAAALSGSQNERDDPI